MKIQNILINQMKHPIGFDLSNLRITFEITDLTKNTGIVYKQLEIGKEGQTTPILKIPFEKYLDNAFQVTSVLTPRTKYWVKINVKMNEEVSEGTSFFETGKLKEPFFGKWIKNVDSQFENTLFKTNFNVKKQRIVKARLYSTALGVYECYLNGKKIGEEYLAPGYTNYKHWLQLQTYDVTNYFKLGKENELFFTVGNGWFKGNLGFSGGQNNIYGDQQAIIAEMHIQYEDGSESVVKTDNNWLTTEGKITKSAIYYGEDFDDSRYIKHWQPAVLLQEQNINISDRLSLPIKAKQILAVKKIIHTPKNELVLDFGQNHAGWPIFYNRLATGEKIKLEMGEILQDDNFYRDNLRLARAAFIYISDGKKKWVRPHFTYYGFRYVKVSGLDHVNPNDFKSWVLYSDLNQNGSIKTNNPKVNRLFENVIWGQKSNFMDIPTDCPQRDERLGWTGDAEIFAPTACFNMNTFEFYKKYAKDMLIEQRQNKGLLPIITPSLKDSATGMAIWSDAATIIPWMTYQFYGDLGVLRQNYVWMKSWVDWITHNTTTPYLWTGQMQLGDWLSLDNGTNPKGKTDETYISSLYYAYSAGIVSKTARLLHLDRDADYYQNLEQNIKPLINDQYVTRKGKIAIDTQTALVLALKFNLVRSFQKEQVVDDLVHIINRNNKKLQTGFVGTPYLLPALSQNKQHKLAVDIFLNEECPGWLYEVNQGATTIWERWNSVLSNGRMNPEGMNSLNHYSFGSVISWMYQYVVGISEFDPGFKNIIFSPKFDYRLKDVFCIFKTSYGKLNIAYHLETNKQHLINIQLKIPFGIQMKVKLPRSEGKTIKVNSVDKGGQFWLKDGNYVIRYIPTKSYLNYFSLQSNLTSILDNSKLVHKIDQVDSLLLKKLKAPSNERNMFINRPINDFLKFKNISEDNRSKIEQILNKTLIV